MLFKTHIRKIERRAILVMSLCLIATPASAHDPMGALLGMIGAVLPIQLIPLYAIVPWRQARYVFLHIAVIVASWALALLGLFGFELSLSLLALALPFLSYPIFARVRSRSVTAENKIPSVTLSE